MSEYWQTYQRRINHLGRTPQERAKRIGILEFERNLKYNAQTQTFTELVSMTVASKESCLQTSKMRTEFLRFYLRGWKIN